MRIIRGQFKGRIVEPPEGMETRPTADRVREAVFQILEVRWLEDHFRDRLVFDLYAGSGAIGIEALSRGAARVVFFEASSKARRAIQNNLDEFGIDEGSYEFVTGELPEALATHATHTRAVDEGKATVIFSDPPYDDDNQDELGQLLNDHPAVAPDAVWCHECAADRRLDTTPWAQVDRREYGNTAVHFMFRDLSDG
jgi:16S rRNA (guanine966-N2)-methyltransferase